MANRQNPQLSLRKQPKQARSEELVSTILEAAAHVLAKEGAHRFTTARVAEKAGVSVGSIYQYFPNKAAILFRLQSDEWRQTTGLLRDTLRDADKPPFERLRTLVRAFLRSECDEAELRVALNDAAPFYRDSPEAKNARAPGHHATREFMKEVLPEVPTAARALAAKVITTTLSAVGKQFSETARTPVEIHAFADAMADMLCAYLRGFQTRRSKRLSRTKTCD